MSAPYCPRCGEPLSYLSAQEPGDPDMYKCEMERTTARARPAAAAPRDPGHASCPQSPNRPLLARSNQPKPPVNTGASSKS